MATTRKAKSADDIRRQTDGIYKTAIAQLSAGRMSREEFNALLDRARDAERKYLSNIEKQSRYKAENATSYKTARATKYSRRVYMTGNNG